MKLKGNELLMFRLLKERAVNNEVIISRKEIAEEINCSKRTVSNLMRALEKKGYVKVISGAGRNIKSKFTIIREEE